MYGLILLQEWRICYFDCWECSLLVFIGQSTLGDTLLPKVMPTLQGHVPLSGVLCKEGSVTKALFSPAWTTPEGHPSFRAPWSADSACITNGLIFPSLPPKGVMLKTLSNRHTTHKSVSESPSQRTCPETPSFSLRSTVFFLTAFRRWEQRSLIRCDPFSEMFKLPECASCIQGCVLSPREGCNCLLCDCVSGDQ